MKLAKSEPKPHSYNVNLRLTLVTYVNVTVEAASTAQAQRLACDLKDLHVERLIEAAHDGPDAISIERVHKS